MSSWGWAQGCSKHVKDSSKHIIEEIVRQVGHLPELYEDAQSEKYNIIQFNGTVHEDRSKWNILINTF